MNIGDMVRLRRDPNSFYDWCTTTPRRDGGYYLRDPKTRDLLNTTSSILTAKFGDDDMCLVLKSTEENKNLILVLNPRNQIGLIHKDKIEVIR